MLMSNMMLSNMMQNSNGQHDDEQFDTLWGIERQNLQLTVSPKRKRCCDSHPGRTWKPLLPLGAHLPTGNWHTQQQHVHCTPKLLDHQVFGWLCNTRSYRRLNQPNHKKDTNKE
uniref:Uncharacterized protein n=1 Tax=Eutreptiella gymnastica TaxID=73025 RepID=A0A7S1NDV1_9EUGL|mmetsp:Transcript_20312/g.36274  ORF Transcript_20312/g.36274 Transcript_20312/m.36274 type:complete len:114 (+) Transcript_20312:194-535(+)